MLQANPNLLPTNVKAVMESTAVGLGTAGKDNEYGNGRINAYQAVLLSLAYANKSINQTATARNNGRRLVRDASDRNHLVFASGGEIFYRRSLSPPNDNNWETPIRLSSGNGSNDFPCITLHNTSDPYVVWQRKTGTDTYEIRFAMSRDDGTTWTGTDKYVLVTVQSSSDPLPVIQADYNALNKLIVFRANAGLLSYSTASQYPGQSNWTQRSVSGTTSTDFSPALTDKDDGTSHIGLAYAKTYGKICYRYFITSANAWSGFTFLSDIVPGSNFTHKEPTISALPSGSPMYVAWHRVEGSGANPSEHVIVFRKSTNHSSWPNEYTLIFYESQQLPSITALASNKIDVVFQTTSQNSIYRQRYDGSSWTFPISEGPGQYPSVSSGRPTARIVLTSGSSSPYTVQLSSTVLSKESTSDEFDYSRSIAWLDSSGAYLEVRVHRLGLKMKDGSEQRMEFMRAELDSFQLTPTNSWDFQTSVPSVFSARAESLIVEYTIAAEHVEKVAELASGSRQITVRLHDTSNRVLASVDGAKVASSGNINKTRYRLTTALGTLGLPLDSTPLKINVRIDGFEPKSATFASLGHIYDFTQSSSQQFVHRAVVESGFTPKTAALFDNYPNPFNPETVIKYQILQQAHVTLKIYNLIGQEVRTLVDRIQDTGVYEIHWDGKDGWGRVLPSGLYLYRIEAGEYSQVRKMALLR
jgi:hypothetical protein